MQDKSIISKALYNVEYCINHCYQYLNNLVVNVCALSIWSLGFYIKFRTRARARTHTQTHTHTHTHTHRRLIKSWNHIFLYRFSCDCFVDCFMILRAIRNIQFWMVKWPMMMTWKEFGMNGSWPNRDVIPAFLWWSPSPLTIHYDKSSLFQSEFFHTVRDTSSSFKSQYFLFSLSSSSNCFSLLAHFLIHLSFLSNVF